MHVLVLNCGSSSLKFEVIETDVQRMREDTDQRLARGVIERIGGQALVTVTVGGTKRRFDMALRDQRDAIDKIVRWIVSPEAGVEGIDSIGAFDVVGHRVVHGGEHFRKSVRIDSDVIAGIEDCFDLAPLHNPANLGGIRAIQELLGPGVPQVAVFDTAFHATMPDFAYLYGIPYAHYRRYKIRRYGFHGTSHRYVAYRYRKITNKAREDVNLVTLHLGNGCSACAIQAGQSVDTSMGFTPIEGLLMGTRAGDVDASILDYLSVKEGLSLHAIETMLNKQSGLLGISGLTNDMRELLDEIDENDDRRARLAVDIFCYRVRKYIGAYHAALGGADAVVFTGGIGENSPRVRARICRGLEALGLELDPAANEAATGGDSFLISTPDARLAAYVIPTNEELLIARDAVRVAFGS